MTSLAAAPSERRVPRWLARHETLLATVLIIALAILGALNNRFLTLDNLLNQGRLMTEVGLIALPMTFIIITGGIDLSVGSVVGLCAIALGYSWKNLGFPLPAAIAFAIALRALRVHQRLLHHAGQSGAADHDHSHSCALSRFCRRHQSGPFRARLSRMVLFHGPRRAFRRSDPALAPRRGDHCRGGGAKTTFGRSLYAIGANETAARFSGLPVDRIKLVVYTLSGLMAGVSAYVLVSRVTTTRSDMGIGYELDVIAAVVLGGTSIFGGSGTIWGTVVGLVMIQLLKDGLALTGVKGDATIVVIGTVLIASTLLASSLQKRRDVGG